MAALESGRWPSATAPLDLELVDFLNLFDEGFLDDIDDGLATVDDGIGAFEEAGGAFEAGAFEGFGGHGVADDRHLDLLLAKIRADARGSLGIDADVVDDDDGLGAFELVLQSGGDEGFYAFAHLSGLLKEE